MASTAAGAVTVRATRALTAALEAESAGLTGALIKSFQTWKQDDGYGHYLFGKDSAYAQPSVDGMPYQLRHVHMVPLSDDAQLKLEAYTDDKIEAKILRFHHVEGWGVHTIAVQLGVHHSTVDRVLSLAGLPKIQRATRPCVFR